MINYGSSESGTIFPVGKKDQLWRIMKLTTFLLVWCCLHLSAASLSQTVTIKANKQPLPQVLDAIKQQTGYLIMYNDRFVTPDMMVSISANAQPLENVLNQVLNPLRLTYHIEGNTIAVRKMKVNRPLAKVVSPANVEAEVTQQRVVTGRVTDQEGNALEGVTVSLKGTTLVVRTDASGMYGISIPQEGNTLVFSIVGFESSEHAVGNQTTMNVSMKVSISDLEEVVVVGYGTMKRADVAGSISSIKEAELKSSLVTSLDQAIQGRVSGVQVTQTSSAPGGNVSIRIRGGNSLSSSNEPLYVVDGFPVSSGASAGGRGVGQNPLATINPNDIVSIEILKDASASAVYGARGANGVVLITTKRGETGRAKVSISTQTGVQKLANKLDMMNAVEYAELVNEARANNGQPPVFPNNNDLFFFPDPSTLGKGVDYQDEVFKDAALVNTNVGIVGGSERIRYSLGGNWFRQDGIIRNTDFNRYSLRANLDVEILPSLTLKTNTTVSKTMANGTTSEGDGGGNGGAVVWSTILMPPTMPIYDQSGKYTFTNPTPGGTPTANPVAIVDRYSDEQSNMRFLTSIGLNWEIIKDLNFNVVLGTDISNADRAYYWPKETFTGFSRNGEGGQAYNKQATYLNENTLSYQKTISGHSMNVMAGYTWQTFNSQRFNTGASNFPTDIFEFNNLGAGTVFLSPGSAKEHSSLASYLGRVNYSFDNKYIVTLLARADGSSKFGANNKWAFFQSAAVAWRLTEEDFIKKYKWLSDLKLRASYGTTGNQNIANYRSLAGLNVMNYPFGDALISGIGPGNIPNPDLKWETTSSSDFGIDGELFERRLTFVVDYYYKKTKDLLWNVTIPSSSGFSSIFKNIGSLENKGWEVAVGTNIGKRGGNFNWNTQLSWSKNKNKVLEIPGYTSSSQGSLSGHLKINGSWLEPGLPVGVWKLLRYDGVFQNEEQLNAGPRTSTNDQLGDPRFVDVNNDGQINLADDRMIVGDPNPKFIFGWTNHLTFKNFDLSVLVNGSVGNDIINVQKAETNISGPWGNQRREILNRWTSTNPTSTIPRASMTVNPSLVQSDWLIEDGTYVRVKNINLGYTFEKIKSMEAVRVYVSAQNLFTITNYSGFDPEVNSVGSSNLQLGVDYNAYPSAKVFTIGINVLF